MIIYLENFAVEYKCLEYFYVETIFSGLRYI